MKPKNQATSTYLLILLNARLKIFGEHLYIILWKVSEMAASAAISSSLRESSFIWDSWRVYETYIAHKRGNPFWKFTPTCSLLEFSTRVIHLSIKLRTKSSNRHVLLSNSSSSEVRSKVARDAGSKKIINVKTWRVIKYLSFKVYLRNQPPRPFPINQTTIQKYLCFWTYRWHRFPVKERWTI